MTPEEAREKAGTRVDGARDTLLELGRALHADPETAFEEYRAAERVGALLGGAGFTVKTGVYGLDTAVEATFGSGDLRVVVCAEYDALPGLGHACGHNIISAAGVGAALGLAEVADELGLTVVLLGTPAEEHGGGKVLMLEAGAWDEATLSLMVHPMPGHDISGRAFTAQAVDRFRVTYSGAAAHAAAAPSQGVNAADAATVAQVGIGLLRQQLPDDVRLSANVVRAGEATNIIPAESVMEAEVRGYDLDTLENVKKRMLACFEAGAIASGCDWVHEETEPRYENVVQEPALAELWDENLRRTGRTIRPREGSGGGSTDMGNVSHYLPSIHPTIAVLGASAAPHTTGFAEAAGTAEGDEAALDAARALAWTVIGAASDPGTREDLLERQDHRSPYRKERHRSEGQC
ncbi:amidohydrolase [Nocardiopsis salina]|uniref:amidohydrolase n=1 Tax=Nocardiopsis salina TaxID=245836 RepID=UPI000345B597|nr:amidohydrolase [Nocardiopsis salina]